jgi:predicted TIM-barrel fold metal-dependent hydrolase
MVAQNPLLPRHNTSLLPEGAWDTHHHIFPLVQPSNTYFGLKSAIMSTDHNLLFSTDKYPLAPTRSYTPDLASLEACLDFERQLGISHTVLAHGLPFGTDLTSVLDFLRYFGGSARAIGVIDHETISLSQLKALHVAGMRAVRINYPQYNAIGNVEKQISLIRKQAACIGQVGWALQIQDNNPHLWTQVSREIDDDRFANQLIIDISHGSISYIRLSRNYQCRSSLITLLTSEAEVGIPLLNKRHLTLSSSLASTKSRR